MRINASGAAPVRSGRHRATARARLLLRFRAASAGRHQLAPLPGLHRFRLARRRLDDLPAAAPDELVVRAERQAADAGRLLYAFRVLHDGCEIASGRIAVVLDVAWGSAR
jgi:hypothetical protein